jgi:integrase
LFSAGQDSRSDIGFVVVAVVVATMGSIPSYIAKHRQSYVLQRAVPRSLQQALGRRVWKSPGGKTLSEARRLLQAFLDATDREIAIAMGELSITADEHIDSIPKFFDLNDEQVADALRTGVELDTELTDAQRARAIDVVSGKSVPQIFTGSNLIDIATSLKSPAKRTRDSWIKELDQFLAYCNTHSPLYCTKEQAIQYRTDLLARVSANTAKTKLAYLTGLWSVLEEVKECNHIFKGITKRIKVTKQTHSYQALPVEEWKDSKWNDVFLILRYTGCRLAEVAGLTYEDIGTDRLYIRPHNHRTLKTAASTREVPIHPKLKQVLSRYDKGSGPIWPTLGSDGRWGMNLSKPCRTITGINPHGHRHNVATKLRENGYNETVIGKLLGHTPNTVTGNYGSVPWSKLVEAVESI